MNKPKLLAIAAAAAIAAGSLGLSAGSASAQPYRGPGYHGHYEGSRMPGWRGHRQVCRPVFRTVKVRGYHGWHYKKVVVGQRCFWPARPHW